MPPNNRLLDLIHRVAQSATWVWDPQTDRLRPSEGLFRLLGVHPAHEVYSTEMLLESVDPVDRPIVSDALSQGVRERDLDPVDIRVIRADGELRYLRMALSAPNPGRQRPGPVLGVVRDVTDERLAARRIAMRAAVSAVLANWTTLHESGLRLLEAIASGLGCESGTLWVPERDLLVPVVNWSAPRLLGSDFERVTRAMRVPKGVGLAGWAWETRTPIDHATMSAARRDVRREVAEAAGLKTAAAFRSSREARFWP